MASSWPLTKLKIRKISQLTFIPSLTRFWRRAWMMMERSRSRSTTLINCSSSNGIRSHTVMSAGSQFPNSSKFPPPNFATSFKTLMQWIYQVSREYQILSYKCTSNFSSCRSNLRLIRLRAGLSSSSSRASRSLTRICSLLLQIFLRKILSLYWV